MKPVALARSSATPTALIGRVICHDVRDAAGKVADVVVWSGDPFEFSSAPEKVFIRGVETSLKTRETELRDRYRTLPPSY